MSDQRPPSVAIEIDSIGSTGPDAPEPIEDSERSKTLVGATALLMLALTGGLLWAVDRSADERVAEQANAAANSDGESPADSEGSPAETIEDLAVVRGDLIDDGAFEWQPIGDPIFDATPFRDGWVARRAQGLGSRIVFSTDGLVWEPFDDSTASGAFRGLDVVDGEIHTLANSAALGQLEFMMRAVRSTDGMDFEPLPNAEPHIASGNQPTHVELEFGRRIVVGDQPLDVERAPDAVIELLETFTDVDIASQTCELRARPGSQDGFDLVSCGGETIGVIRDPLPRVADMLSTVSFLLRFQNVITVQTGSAPLERFVLEPGQQVATIAPTPDGFLAIVLNTLGGLDPERRVLGEPTGVLLHWTPPSGLRDITDRLDPDIDLTDWMDNDLEVSSDGTATIATGHTVYRSAAPYWDWPVVREAPTESDSEASVLHVGPDGQAMAFSDEFGRMWVGRRDDGWYRAPLLDDSTLIDVLLSNEEAIVIVLGEESAFSPTLVRVELPASETTTESETDSVPSDGIDPDDIEDIVSVGDELLGITTQGDIAISSDATGIAVTAAGEIVVTDGDVTWTRLPQLTSFGLRAIAIDAVEADGVDILGEVLVMAESTVQNPSRWIGTYRLRRIDGSFALTQADFDNARGQLVVGDRQTTSLKDADVGPLSIALTHGPVTEPEPEVTAVLTPSLRADVAENVCSVVTDRFEDGSKFFDLLDCDGEQIASNRGPGLFPGNEVHDRFIFVQGRLARSSVVHITGPESSGISVPLFPGLIGFHVAATEVGAAILASDTRPILEDFDRFYDTDTPNHVLLLVDPDDGSIREIALPDEVQNTLVPNISIVVPPNGLGAFQLSSDVGPFRYFAETDTWERVSATEFVDAWERVLGLK